MYYLFHDKVWMCFEGELPVKPEPSHYTLRANKKPLVGANYFEADERRRYDLALEKYNQAIATLKSKALVVENDDILKGMDYLSSYFMLGDIPAYEWKGKNEIHAGKIRLIP